MVSYYMEWVTTSWTYSTYSSHDKLFLRNTPPSWIYSCARACVHYALCAHAKLTRFNTFQLFPSNVQKVCSVILACELGLFIDEHNIHHVMVFGQEVWGERGVA